MNEPKFCEGANGSWSVALEDSGCRFFIGQQFCREKRVAQERRENTSSMTTSLLKDFGKANKAQTKPKQQTNETKEKKPERHMGGDGEQSAFREMLSQWSQNLALLI